MIFSVAPLVKAGKQRGYVLVEIDEIRNNLEEDQTELQAILSSRYIASVKGMCERWETALNTISEVLDLWLKV